MCVTTGLLEIEGENETRKGERLGAEGIMDGAAPALGEGYSSSSANFWIPPLLLVGEDVSREREGAGD
jgi:hypothetical protein